MSPAVTRYGVPGLLGAAIVFAIRFIFADLAMALIGIGVFAVIFAVLLVLSRLLKWQDAPGLYAAVSAIAATLAFVITGTES